MIGPYRATDVHLLQYTVLLMKTLCHQEFEHHLEFVHVDGIIHVGRNTYCENISISIIEITTTEPD